jgi:hypothetical protein
MFVIAKLLHVINAAGVPGGLRTREVHRVSGLTSGKLGFVLKAIIFSVRWASRIMHMTQRFDFNSQPHFAHLDIVCV